MRCVVLWRSAGECENYGVLGGHKGAVLDLHWSRDSRSLFSASADWLLASWDVDSGTRTRRFTGHEDIINCMDTSRRGEEVLVSGSDDGCIGLWDARQKQAIDFIETEFPITAIALSEAGNELYSGSIDNDIKVWDIRKKTVAYSLLGHGDTITSLRISPDAQSLLSFSLDSTARTWDIRPFAPKERMIRTFDGASAGIEKNLFKAGWSPDGRMIIAGGGDGSVTVWDNNLGKMLYKAPGHKGSVNDVGFSPVEDNVGKFFSLFVFSLHGLEFNVHEQCDYVWFPSGVSPCLYPDCENADFLIASHFRIIGSLNVAWRAWSLSIRILEVSRTTIYGPDEANVKPMSHA